MIWPLKRKKENWGRVETWRALFESRTYVLIPDMPDNERREMVDAMMEKFLSDLKHLK